MRKLPQLLTCALRIQRNNSIHSSNSSMPNHSTAQQSPSCSRRYHSSSANVCQSHWLFSIIAITFISTVFASVPSPGQLMPVTIEVPIGDSFNLTCTVALSATCEDAANISFKYQDNSAGAVRVFSENVKILDKTTAVLMVENAVEATGTYTCKCNDIGIGISSIYVGTVPLDVTDFDCRWYDFEDIHCQFRKPHNAIITDYELRVHEKAFNCRYNQTWYSCTINAPSHLPSQLNFFVTGNNTIGMRSKVFPVDMYSIVIPTLKFENIVEINTNSVKLQWSVPYIVMFERTAGVVYSIAYRLKSHSAADEWTELKYSSLNVESIGSNKFRAILELPYANYAYVVRIRVKANTARDDVWSEWAQRECRTKAKAPEYAPRIANGSYYIRNMETEPELKLYWQEIDKHQWNATGFKYKVTELNDIGHPISKAFTVTPWHAIPWPKHKSSVTDFYVQSVNDLGESPLSKLIRVYPRQQHSNGYNLSLTVYENKLNWQRPNDFEDLIDYTIFYCLSNTQSRTSCSGSMQYVEHVPKTTTSYELATTGTYIFAIAANYKDYSTGMQWQKCSTDTNAELLKPDLIVNSVHARSLEVIWQTNVCSSIVTGYTLSYGEGLDTTAHRLSIANDQFGTTLRNLKPFTNYSMFLTMHSINGKEISTESIKQQTAEAAPSTPPGELTIDAAATTDSSVKLTWQQPKVLNGRLRSYIIEYRNHSSRQRKEVFVNDSRLLELDSQTTAFELTGLQSDSVYYVSLQAKTVEPSEPANITARTLVGTPSEPLHLHIPPTNTELIWSKPQNIQSNRSTFYLVSLNQYKKNSTAIEKVIMQSLVWTDNCTFQSENCQDDQFNYNLQVQAIVLANISEVYNHSDAYLKSSIDIIKDKSNPSSELCSNSIAVPGISAGDYVFVYSPKYAEYSFPNVCHDNKVWVTFWIAFGVFIGFMLTVYAGRMLMQKYQKMQNIELVLPDGLTIKPVGGVSSKFEQSYKNGGHKGGQSATIGFETPEVLRDANDCFPFSSHDNTNLLPNDEHNISKANGILMGDKVVDEVPTSAMEVIEQFGLQEPEKNSANTTSTSLLSHNSDTCSMASTEEHDDDVYYGNYNESGQEMTSKQNGGLTAQQQQQQQPVINANGYVTAETFKKNINASGYINPNSLMMVSPMPVSMSQPAAPPTITNGYIKVDALSKPMLPLMAQTPLSKTMQPTLNDLTSLELQQKVSLMPESLPSQQPHQSITPATAAQITHTTSTPPLELKLQPASNDDIAIMLQEQPSAGHNLINHSAEHSQNENQYSNQQNGNVNAPHNNTPNNLQTNINGYVTRRQLAEFGHSQQ